MKFAIKRENSLKKKLKQSKPAKLRANHCTTAVLYESFHIVIFMEI